MRPKEGDRPCRLRGSRWRPGRRTRSPAAPAASPCTPGSSPWRLSPSPLPPPPPRRFFARASELSLSLLSRGEGRDQIGERRKRRGSGESNGRRIAMVIRRGGGGGRGCDAMGETAPLQPCGKPRAAVRCGMDG